MRRGRARSGTKVAATRPGRDESSTTRSPRRTASRTLWVTNRTVSFRSSQSRSSSSCSRSRVMASSAPNGSSMSSDVGVLGERAGQRDALAHAAGQLVRPLVAEAAEVHERRAARRRAARRSRLAARRAACSASSTLPRDREPREQRRLLEHQRGAAARPSTVPAVGVSSPATRLSSVLLPQPEAPSRQTNSPRRDVERDAVERERRASRRGRRPWRRRRWRRPVRRGDAGDRRWSLAIGRARRSVGIVRSSGPSTVGSPPGLQDLVEEVEVVDALEVDRLSSSPTAVGVVGRLSAATRRSGRG